MSENSPPYHRVYYDTNVLRKANWPLIGQMMRTTLTTVSRRYGIPNILLVPVELELKAHWLRQCRDTHEEFQKRLKTIDKMYSDVGKKLPTSFEQLAADLGQLEEAYDAMVKKNLQDFYLVRSGAALRETRELFHMAINQKFPFKEKGKNFQDAVICLAVIDDLAASGERVGVLLSADGVFQQHSLDELSEPYGVSIKLFNGEDAFSEDLRTFLMAKQVDEWSADEDLARAAVEQDLPNLQAFVNANLEVPSRYGLPRRILFVKQIDIVGVKTVHTPFPEDRPEGSPVIITVELEINILAKVRGPLSASAATPQTLKAGQEPVNEDSPRTFRTQELDHALTRIVALEIEARLAEGRYVELQPKSVTFDVGGLRDSSRLSSVGALIGAPPKWDLAAVTRPNRS